MKVAEKAVSNTIYLALNWLTLTGLSFLYWVIAGKLLLPSEYGKATTAYQIMFFLGSIANLGLGFAVSKVIPELIMKKQERKIPTIIKFSLKIALSVALVLAILLVLSTPLLNKKLGFNLRDTVFIALGLLFAQLSLFFSRVWYGYQNMRKIWINNIINQVVKLGVATFLIYSSYSYFGLIAGLVAMYFVSFLLYFSPRIIIDGTKYNTKYLLYDLAIPAFFANIFWMIFNNTQYIILSLLKTTESTGYFSLAFMVSIQVAGIVTIITGALFPLISGLNSVGKRETRDLLLSLGIRYSLLITLPMIAFIAIYGEAIIHVFFRPEYLPATKLFPILLPSALTFTISSLLLNNLYAIGKSKIYRNISIMVTVLYLLTAFYLTGKLGYIGMSFSYAITSFTNFVIVVLFARKCFKLRVSIMDIAKLIVAVSVLSIAWCFIRYFSISFYEKLILVMTVSVLYPILLKITKFYSSYDKKVIRIILEDKLKMKIINKLISIFV